MGGARWLRPLCPVDVCMNCKGRGGYSESGESAAGARAEFPIAAQGSGSDYSLCDGAAAELARVTK